MVEGGEHPGDVERFVIRGGVGAAEPQPARRETHCGHEGNEVHLDHPDPLAEGFGHVGAVPVGHRETVVEEREVELSRLEGAGNALEVLGGKKVLRGVRMAPRRGVVRAVRRLEEGDELHLASCPTVRRDH